MYCMRYSLPVSIICIMNGVRTRASGRGQKACVCVTVHHTPQRQSTYSMSPRHRSQGHMSERAFGGGRRLLSSITWLPGCRLVLLRCGLVGLNPRLCHNQSQLQETVHVTPGIEKLGRLGGCYCCNLNPSSRIASRWSHHLRRQTGSPLT